MCSGTRCMNASPDPGGNVRCEFGVMLEEEDMCRVEVDVDLGVRDEPGEQV